MHPSACLRASLLYKQVRVRMYLISACARVQVLVVMSSSVRVSITSDGPQEMLAPHAIPLFLSLLLIVYLFWRCSGSFVVMRWHVCTRLGGLRWQPDEADKDTNLTPNLTPL